MEWVKQKLEYEAERNIALDLTVRVKDGNGLERQSAKIRNDDSKRIVGTSHIASRHAVSSEPYTFLLEDTSLYCVMCKVRHEGDCPSHGPLDYADNAEALHDDDSFKDYRSQILVVPSMLGKIAEVKNKEQFASDVFPLDKIGPSLTTNKVGGAVVAETEELNYMSDPRLTLNKGLMDPFACLDETCHVFQTTNDYTTPLDVNSRELNDFLFMYGNGEHLYKTDTSYKLHSGVPFRKNKTIRTMKQFTCEDRGKVSSSSGNLKIVKASKSVVKLHKCDRCGVRFSSPALLSTHKGVCTGEKPYKCDICGVGFCVNSSLVTHIRIHTGEKPYKCDICGASFTVNSSLISHIRTHTGEKPYKCDICGVGFTVSSGLRTHKRIHTGEKPYKCDLCGSEFTCCSSLKSHKRIHTGEKPYRCDICGVGFPVNGSLKSHKRIHTGEKPYRCDICGVGFTVSTSLSSHRRIHTGEKPYRCDVCGINFTRNGHLQRHKKMHPMEEFCK